MHGIGVSGRYLLPTAALLARRFPVHVVDLPGFGRSPKPPRPLDVEEHADLLAGWLPATGLERAVFVANSFGCQVVVDLAARHAAAVERLVLVGPTVDARARTAARQIVRLALDLVREPLSLAGVVATDYLRAGPRTLLWTARYALAYAIEDKLPAIRAPTLVLRGARDPIVPQRWAEEVAHRLPDGRLAVVPGAPHAVNYAAPEALVAEIEAFLAA